MPAHIDPAGTAAAIAPGLHLADAFALGLLFLGIAVLVAMVALTHQRERAFSPAIVYLAMGAMAAAGIALLDVRWLHLVDDADVVERLSEFAVIVALFATGMRLDRPIGLRRWRSTVLLLAVVMPLTIAAVAAYGAFAMGLSAGAAVVLGAALAPTDPVLAGDVGVGPPGEEDEREPAFALTSEAGLNDGLAFPFVMLGLVMAGGASAGDVGEWLAVDAAYAVAAGLGFGVLGGWAIGAASVRLRDRGLLAPELDGWVAVGAVLTIYGVTVIGDAYGFLAAFTGGIAFRRRERGHEQHEGVHAGAEALERILELAMILLLGSLLTFDGLGAPGPAGWLLAPVLLLLVRPLACLVALRWSALDAAGRLWVGWFGVRGIGTLYYAAAALGAGLLAPGEAGVVIWTCVAVVIVSIVAHGVTGDPLTRRLERRVRDEVEDEARRVAARA